MSESEDRDRLAGEYVLGTLEGAERQSAEALLARDPGFARAVAAWQERLTPLAALAAPAAPPPGLWRRIDAATMPAPRPVAPRPLGIRFWQGSTAGALALAAALAGIMLLRAPAPPVLAVLAGRGRGAGFIAVARAGAGLVLRPIAAIPVLPVGREMELWVLPRGASAPRPLGALPQGGRRGPPPGEEGGVEKGLIAAGAELLVSVEPAGGSPSGKPTGPVIYRGVLRPL